MEDEARLGQAQLWPKEIPDIFLGPAVGVRDETVCQSCLDFADRAAPTVERVTRHHDGRMTMFLRYRAEVPRDLVGERNAQAGQQDANALGLLQAEMPGGLVVDIAAPVARFGNTLLGVGPDTTQQLSLAAQRIGHRGGGDGSVTRHVDHCRRLALDIL